METKFVKIKELKKGITFIFNHKKYEVKRKYSKWKRDDDSFLMTTCKEVFYNGELLVAIEN